MAKIHFNLPIAQVHDVLPEGTPVQKSDWKNLVTRANELPLPNNQRAPGDSVILTADEASNIARIVSEGGQRLYPREQELVPFMRAITAPIDSQHLRAVPAGEIPVIPPPVRSQPTSVPVSSIEERYRSVAARLAETRPGNEDGNSIDLRLSDLSDRVDTLTPDELTTIRRIREKYFPITFAPQNVTEIVNVPVRRNNGVVGHLERKVNMTMFSTQLNDSVQNTKLVFKVPTGAKIVLAVDDVRAIHSKPTRREPDGDVYDISGTGRDYYIKVVGNVEGGGPGLPKVIDAFALRLPESSFTTRPFNSK